MVGFQCQSILLCCKISKTVGFVSLRDFSDCRFCFFVFLWDFKDSRFCFVTRSQWRSVLLLYEISMTVGFHCHVLFFYEILMTFGFDQRFQWWSVLFCYKISMTVGFIRLWDFNNSRISMMVGFVQLRDLNDGQFNSIMRFQWQLNLEKI